MKKIFNILMIISLILTVSYDSYARIGGGKSSGFRSYKSYNYKSYKSNKSTLSHGEEKSFTKNRTNNFRKNNSFFNSGIFKWLIGGMIFGAILSFLMGNGLHFGTPGLLEIILIGVIIYFLFKAFSRPKRETEYATNAGNIKLSESNTQTTGTLNSVENSINEELILNLTKNIFIELQKAWSNGNLTPVRNFLTDRMYHYLQQQLKELKEKGLRNIVENPVIKNIEIVHVEEEGDKKVVVVKIEAEIIDYIIDKNGNIIEGSKTQPITITEYWAFVGKALNWKLDDIKQV